MKNKSKQCTKCNIIKNVNEYYVRKERKNGLKSKCKECENKHKKEYNRSKQGLIAKMYSSQIHSSKHRNMALPTYTKQWFKNWLFNNSEFHRLYDMWAISGYKKMLVPSVDRIDDYISYTECNIQLMTFKENNKKAHNDRIKGIGTSGQLCKKVYQYTKDDILIEEFHSTTEAERQTGVPHQNISKCCNNKRKTAGGYKWQFKL